MDESQEKRDRRIEKLWQRLDTRNEGQLDLQGLQRGLRKIDHPLKNADDLLRDVLHIVDTSGDGRIQFSEFRLFVERAEDALWQLFQRIDRDKNGNLDQDELKAAFQRAGVTISTAKFESFWHQIDRNNDGVISYEEWRDFLMFLPAEQPNLRKILSYYAASLAVNSEGDVNVNETLHGLGTAYFLLSNLIHSVLQSILSSANDLIVKPIQASHLRPPLNPAMSSSGLDEESHSYNESDVLAPDDLPPALLDHELEVEWFTPPAGTSWWIVTRHVKQQLTEFVPPPGYFISGGVAGVISRTATAPLDRLKVYLIAQTGVRKEAVDAARGGSPFMALKLGARTLGDACKDLWKAGGMRSLFAGNGLNVVKVMPESAVKFGSYEAAKRTFARLEGHGDPKALHPFSQFAAGGVGGMISQAFVYPLDTLKFRMQCELVEGGLHGNKLIIATAKKMWAKNGITSFYRGLGMGLAGIAPYAALDLGTFEYLKRILVTRRAKIDSCHEEDVQLGNVETGMIGAFSGAFGASVVYPMNLLRTRLQAQGTALHPATYTGIVDVFRKTLQGEGYRGLFKGLTPNLLKVAPSVSISYIVYENSKRIMGLH